MIRMRWRARIEKMAVAIWPMRNWRRKSAGVEAAATAWNPKRAK
jgi:hypothetical protein